jgi:hypothetical protein
LKADAFQSDLVAFHSIIPLLPKKLKSLKIPLTHLMLFHWQEVEQKLFEGLLSLLITNERGYQELERER